MGVGSRAPRRQICEREAWGKRLPFGYDYGRFPKPVMSKAHGNVTPRDRNAWFISEAEISNRPAQALVCRPFSGQGKLADPRASLSRNSHTLAALPVSAKEAREECG